MKTLRFIGMAIMAVVLSVNFIACSDDNDEPQQNESSIIGKWHCYKVEVDGETYNEDMTFDFKSDNSMTLTWDRLGETHHGHYTLNESGAFSITFSGDDAPVDMRGTLNISGKEMVLTYQWDNNGTAYLKRL